MPRTEPSTDIVLSSVDFSRHVRPPHARSGTITVDYLTTEPSHVDEKQGGNDLRIVARPVPRLVATHIETKKSRAYPLSVIDTWIEADDASASRSAAE